MYDTAHNSFRRLRATGFPTRFYELLLESDPRIRAMFARTDFDKQRDLFMHGVHMLLEFGAGRPTGRMAIDRLSKMHGHAGLKIPPTLYAVWAKTLLDTAREFVTIPDEAIQPPPEGITNLSGRYLAGIARLDERLVLILDCHDVIDPAGMTAIAPQGAATQEEEKDEKRG